MGGAFITEFTELACRVVVLNPCASTCEISASAVEPSSARGSVFKERRTLIPLGQRKLWCVPRWRTKPRWRNTGTGVRSLDQFLRTVTRYLGLKPSAQSAQLPDKLRAAVSVDDGEMETPFQIKHSLSDRNSGRPEPPTYKCLGSPRESSQPCPVPAKSSGHSRTGR